MRLPLVALWAISWIPAATGLTDVDSLRPWISRMKVRRAHPGRLEDLAGEHRVVVVMTTIPPRMERIEVVVDAMLAQTWPIAALYMSIPYVYNRSGEPYVIPDWLLQKPGVTIVRCEDLGPGTHLLNGLRLEKDPWTFFVVVDDDHIYSPDLVETLMRAALAHPGSAVAAQGFLSVPGLELHKDSPRYLHDQGFAAGPVLVSYLGVVYQRGFFDDSVFDYSDVATHCKYQDDMWFSAHLAKKGIRRAVLGGALGVQELRDMHLGPESLTFWEENKPRVISAECDRTLKRQRADIWAFRRRFVLALGGLPPLLPRDTAASSCSLQAASGGESAGLVDADAWRGILASLGQLPYQPDLIYLCTELPPSTGAGAGAGHCSGPRGSLGTSFRLDGLLVAVSDACRAGLDQEPRVGDLLRDVLRWEGESTTVLAFGPWRAVNARGADLEELVGCAAQRFAAEEEDEQTRREAARLLASNGPFCRSGEVGAVAVGAFESMARS